MAGAAPVPVSAPTCRRSAQWGRRAPGAVVGTYGAPRTGSAPAGPAPRTPMSWLYMFVIYQMMHHPAAESSTAPVSLLHMLQHSLPSTGASTRLALPTMLGKSLCTKIVGPHACDKLTNAGVEGKGTWAQAGSSRP